MEYYVNKNQYGYVGIEIDNENKVVYFYGRCKMTIDKHKKVSKKVIKEIFDRYKDMGYKTIIK